MHADLWPFHMIYHMAKTNSWAELTELKFMASGSQLEAETDTDIVVLSGTKSTSATRQTQQSALQVYAEVGVMLEFNNS